MEIDWGQVKKGWDEIFFGALLVQLEGLIHVYLHSFALFIAYTQIVECPRTTFLSRFLEPLSSLTVLMFIIEQWSKRIHCFLMVLFRKLWFIIDAYISCSFFILSDSYLSVLLDFNAMLVKVAKLIDSFFTFFLCCFLIKLKCYSCILSYLRVIPSLQNIH